MQPYQPYQLGQPGQPSQPMQPYQPAPPSQPMWPYQPGQPSQPMQPYQPVPPSQPYQQYPSQETYQQYPIQQPYGSYGAYGPQMFGGQQPYPVPMDEPEPHSRSPLTALLTGGIVILVIAMAGGAALLVSQLHAASANTLPSAAATATATAAPTVTPTPGPPAGFITYTDPGGSYQVFMPSDWTLETPPSSATTATMFVSPDGAGAFLIGRYSAAVSQSMFSASEKTFFSDFSTKEGGPGTYSNLQGPSTVSLAGEHWVQESADVPVRNGITLHLVLLLANHAGHAYLIAYIAYPTDFNRLNKQDFQPIEHSFKFLP